MLCNKDTVIHLKTGKRYGIIEADVIECTNGREELKYVIYTDGHKTFCREREEFNRKFQKEECDQKY